MTEQAGKTEQGPLWQTVAEYAAEHRVSKDLIYKEVARGNLDYRRYGRRIVIAADR